MSKGRCNLVSFEFFPYKNGGLARHSRELMNQLILNKSYKMIIATDDERNEKLTRIERIRCRFFNVPLLSYLEFSLRFFLKYLKLYNTERFVFFSAFSYYFIPILPKDYDLFIHNTAKRVFLTDYPNESFKEKMVRKTAYYLFYNWERYLAKNARKVYAVSDSTMQDVISHYKIDALKVRLVPNGFSHFSKFSKPRRMFKNNLLFVGRIVPRKNLEDLIKVMKLLNKVSDYNLLIVGNGDEKYKSHLLQLIERNGLSKNIIFKGFLSDKELTDIYNQSDLFVFSSLVEGFGLVLVESMNKGLPVIAYDIPGVRDVIQNGLQGFLVKPGDYTEFAKKVLLISKSNSIYTTLSVNAIRRSQDFDWKKTAVILNREVFHEN